MESEYADFFAQQQATLDGDQIAGAPSSDPQDTPAAAAADNADFNKWMTEQFGPDFQTQDMAQQDPQAAASSTEQVEAPNNESFEKSGGYSPSSIPFELQPRAYSPSAPIMPFGEPSPAVTSTALPPNALESSFQTPQAPEAIASQVDGEALSGDATDGHPLGDLAPNEAETAYGSKVQERLHETQSSSQFMDHMPPAPAVDHPLPPSMLPPTLENKPVLPPPPTFTPSQPLSPLEAARAQIQKTKQDHVAWKNYLTLAEGTGNLDKIRDAYEEALHTFPNTAAIQIAYLNHYLTPPLFQKAEALFARFLRPSPSVELWKFYLTYVRRINANITDPAIRDIVRKAYEFALVHVGQDMDAGQIWRDYIDFLKNSLDSRTTWDAQQKMDALRSAYHRAVVIPLDNVEALWRELDAYENGLNKITAKKFLGDLSPSHQSAKLALRDLKRLLSPITSSASSVAVSPTQFDLPPVPTWTTEQDRSLSAAWKSYIKWEEGNPLDLDDHAALHSRIVMAYRKAVSRMRFYPEITYQAYHSLTKLGKAEEALATLKQGTECNPSSFVLAFAYAEIKEIQKELPEVHATFDTLITNLRSGLEDLESQIESDVASARQSVLHGGDLDEASAPAVVEAEDRARKVRERRAKDIETAKNELGLVWIMLMRFARRSEGLKPARTVFAKARKDKWCAWAVYEAAALMEYHCTKASEVATKIFEIGLKQFADSVEYVVRYLGFLISVNDENNARALFERTITSFPGEKGRPLWERWARYEYNFADLPAAQKLEQRIGEALPNNPPIKQFAYKYTYLSIDAIATRDLGFGRQAPVPTAIKAEPIPLPIAAPSPSNPGAGNGNNKRAGSPSRRREPSPPPKRFRGASPPRARERERDRDWDRDRDRGRPRNFSPRRRDVDAVPEGIAWFLGTLPNATAFDGPKFRTEDLMHLLKTASLPSVGPPEPRRSRSPPPRGGRPPPDYGPYQGPGGNRRRY